jgi:hypothetical protein
MFLATAGLAIGADKVVFLDAPEDPSRKENLAYVGNGAKPATASSVIPGFAQHRPEGLNDGKYGNASGWICAPEDAAPWFQIDLGQQVKVSCIALGRDRNGEFADRTLTTLAISVSNDGKEWQKVYAADNFSGLEGYGPGLTAFIAFQETACRYLKVNVNNGACVDECEVYAVVPKTVLAARIEEEVVMEIPPLTAKQLFRQAGTDREETFATVRDEHRFDVVNISKSHLMVAFGASAEASVTPGVVRLAPGGRQAVTLKPQTGAKTFSLSYAFTMAAAPFTTHANRYRAYSDGETVMCVPVAPAHHAALKTRTKSILRNSLAKVSDPAMPAGTVIYTPGPFYKHAGIFARDFLYQLEGAGRYTATAEETKRAVDYLALKQLTEKRKVGAFTYPKGAIPDHVYPDGRWSWGPGAVYGDDTGRFGRPSMDEAMCFVTLAWHYGYKANWDAAWQAWFKEKAQRFADAWNSVPRNPKTGLVTQWSTPGHIGAQGITETDGACVMWGFHDSYGFGGDDVGVSVLACNAARALADMHEHAGNAEAVTVWGGVAVAMRDAIRAQFHKDGYLPWGVGASAPTMASPDITGYAVWSGILTDAQADAASDWFAARYRADKAAGGAADLFHMSAPFRGAVRMARKADDVSPGRHVWPDMRDGNHWENLTYGYNAYQDGGYWYYMSLGVAVALNRKHPDLAREWVGNAYADLAGADANPPYERIDGMTPVNNRYNASVGPLMGMGMPAVVATIQIGGDAQTADEPARGEVKTVASFLRRMRTLDHLPELETSHLSVAGTWDRLDANWDAIDFRNLKGNLNVMLDVAGPGCVTRIMEGTLNNYGVPEAYGTIEGTVIRIYLDNNPKPTFDMPLATFLDSDKGPFPNPMTWTPPRNGHTFPGVVFPIPYAKHCKIELFNPQGKHWGSYWNIWYVTYPAGTQVKTLSWPLDAAEKLELEEVCKTWLQAIAAPPAAPEKWSKTETVALKANEVRSMRLAKAGVIDDFRVAVTPGTPQVLQGIRLQMFWDGNAKPGVDAPLGYFFGNGKHGADPTAFFNSLMLGVTADGAYCRLPMPFAQGAEIRFINQSGQTVTNLDVKLHVKELPSLPKSWGRFQATWLEHRTMMPDSPTFGRGSPVISKKPEGVEYFLPYNKNESFPTKYVQGHLVLERAGKGKYVGMMMHVNWPYDGWWGEGDVLIWTDETGWPPSYHTTGMEESFNAGWCGFDRKAISGYAKQTKPDWVFFGFNLIDGAAFDKNIKVGVETMPQFWDGLPAFRTMQAEHPIIGSTAYWYAESP